MTSQKEVQEKIEQLQLLEQKMQNFLMQRQQLQTQLVEIDSALEELKTANTAYKIIGSIMVSSKTEDLQKELNDKKEMVELRMKTLEKQEEQSKEKAKTIQEEVLGSMEKK